MTMLHAALPALLLLAVLAPGCRSVPTTEYYDVQCELDAALKPGQTMDASVMVRPFSAVESYDQPQVAYRSSPYRLYYDAYREWSAAPGRLVWGQFARCLSHSGLFRTVLHSSFPSRTDYQIFGRVLKFYELEEANRRFAVLELELTLTDASERPIFSITPGAKVQAPPAEDLSGVAEAMSRALEQTFAEFLRAAQKHLPPSDK